MVAYFPPPLAFLLKAYKITATTKSAVMLLRIWVSVLMISLWVSMVLFGVLFGK